MWVDELTIVVIDMESTIVWLSAYYDLMRLIIMMMMIESTNY